MAEEPGSHVRVSDIKAWKGEHGEIPEGAVVIFRSDWHVRWTTDPDRYDETLFPGVGLDAAQYLHKQNNTLFHRHEPRETDTTAGPITEDWVLTTITPRPNGSRISTRFPNREHVLQSALQNQSRNGRLSQIPRNLSP